MFSLNNLKMMEIIDIETGLKLGFIKDFKINIEEDKIESIILPGKKGGWFSKSEDVEISWNDIEKIGVDVILVHANSNLVDMDDE